MSTPRELTMTRLYDAPRALVFKAWTDPVEVAKWWGPKGFTTVMRQWSKTIDITMTGHGMSHPMGGAFLEVVPNERLVFTAIAYMGENGEPALENLNTVTFEDVGGKTKVTVHVVVQRATETAAPALAGMEMGWNQSLDRLGDLVSQR
jgi:uncharacterized protein YndB with AHSA1/START domain